MQEAEAKDKGVASADSDPWIAALRFQVGAHMSHELHRLRVKYESRTWSCTWSCTCHMPCLMYRPCHVYAHIICVTNSLSNVSRTLSSIRGN